MYIGVKEMYRATLEDYLTATTIIEEEFGLQWLDRRANTPKRPDQAGWHPIPSEWKEAKDILSMAEQTGIIQPTKAFISLMSFANDLRRARSLPNYKKAIQPRLKNWREFLKVQYEVYTASLCVRSGHDPVFIPPSTASGERTPDLKLQADGDEVYVECVRRDSYQIEQMAGDELWETLRLKMSALLDEISASHEVIVIAISAIDENVIPHILQDVKRRVSAGEEGISVHQEAGYGLSIRPLPESPPEEGYALIYHQRQYPDQEMQLFIPAGMAPVFVFGKIVQDANGRKSFKNVNRIALYKIDSHRLRSVINTFNNKRKQIPPNGLGIICLDVDARHVKNEMIPLYLDIVSTLLKTYFLPQTNTTIGAVILTAMPVFIETFEDGSPFIILHRPMMIVRNPYVTLPEEFLIPGEKLSEDESAIMIQRKTAAKKHLAVCAGEAWRMIGRSSQSTAKGSVAVVPAYALGVFPHYTVIPGEIVRISATLWNTGSATIVFPPTFTNIEESPLRWNGGAGPSQSDFSFTHGPTFGISGEHFPGEDFLKQFAGIAVAPGEKFNFIWGTFQVPTDQPQGTLIKAELLNFQVFFTDTIFSSLGPVRKPGVFDFMDYEKRPTVTFMLGNQEEGEPELSFFEALVFDTTTGEILSPLALRHTGT